ncbi:MAG: hypothetical protein ACXQTH_01545 [Dehalococcoidia bacterium]
MYKKMLVPLDGSKLAECALPHVEELAKGCGPEEVIPVSVTERVQRYGVLEGAGQPNPWPNGWLAGDQSAIGQRLLAEAFGEKEKQARRYLTE